MSARMKKPRTKVRMGGKENILEITHPIKGHTQSFNLSTSSILNIWDYAESCMGGRVQLERSL